MTKCKKCSEEIGKKDKACPSCGSKQKPGILKQAFFGLVGAIVLITVISAITEGGDGDSANSAQADREARMPESQLQFVGAAQQARQSASEASNDMAKGGIRADRAAQICQALAGNAGIQGWVGEVTKIDSNSDGKGVLSISLAENVTVTTWNNALSDIGSGTLIEPNTDLFNTVSAMTRGDLVEFGGQFTQSDVDCVGEQSLTLDGSLTDPEYTMVFENVRPLPTGS